MYNSLSVDNKPCKYAFLSGQLIYTSYPDYSYAVMGSMNDIIKDVSIWNSNVTYTVNGQTYVCDGYGSETGMERAYAPGLPAEGGLTPAYWITRHIVAMASHVPSQDEVYMCVDPEWNEVDWFSIDTAPGWMNLETWALDNGWTSTELSGSGASLIKLARVGDPQNYQDEISPDAFPYFIKDLDFQALFRKDQVKNIPGWTATGINDFPFAQPIWFTTKITDGYGNSVLRWSTPNHLSANIPVDYAPDLKNLGRTYLGTTGDSGRPVWMNFAGKKVLLSHCDQIYIPAFSPTPPYFMVGPDYTKLFPILDKFVKQVGGDEGLKRLTI